MKKLTLIVNTSVNEKAKKYAKEKGRNPSEIMWIDTYIVRMRRAEE